jgi:hypothetical protein
MFALKSLSGTKFGLDLRTGLDTFSECVLNLFPTPKLAALVDHVPGKL